MDPTLIIFCLLLIFLVFSSGYFSGSETALFSLPAAKLRTYAHSKDPTKKLIANLLKKPRDLLVTVFMLNTLVNILLQNTSSAMFGGSASWIFKVGIPLLLTLIFGEIIPKNIGLERNEAFAHLTAPSIARFQKWLGPVRRGTIAITAPLSRLLFFYLKKEEEISQEELQHVLKTSEAYGVLDSDEAELVNGYLNLQNLTAKEIMRPKEDILFYDIHDPLTTLTHLFAKDECSRLPVCDKNLDTILGIVTAQRYFLCRDRIHKPEDLKFLLRKPLFIPESMPARKLLRKFDEAGEVISIVVDEYGSINGLITKEDLAEVVIGQVSDLRDQKTLYTHSGTNEIIASGKLELNELNNIFSTTLKSDTMLTVGGWLTENLGDIPPAGGKYELEGFLFHILAADPNRLRRLYIRQLSGEDQ